MGGVYEIRRKIDKERRSEGKSPLERRSFVVDTYDKGKQAAEALDRKIRQQIKEENMTPEEKIKRGKKSRKRSKKRKNV